MLHIIVPYRDREEHKKQFIPHMRAYLPEAKIVVVEQSDDKPFNRGKLINIGYMETLPNYFVAHDVDMLPLEVDYFECAGVTQLAKSSIQKHGYLGGVTMFDKETFEKVGGYHNEYFHRAEDNELRANLQRLKIPVLELHGKFMFLPHPRSGPEFIASLWYKSQEPRVIQNQLGKWDYPAIEHIECRDYLHIKVAL